MRFERKQSISKKDINAIANKVEEKHSKKRLLIILGVLLTIVIVIYLVVETNTTGKRLVEGYDTLTARKQESKSEFSKNAKKFITNPDGSITLTDSYLISQEDNDAKEDTKEEPKNVVSSGVDWSAVADTEMKQQSLETVYVLLKKYNASDEFIAGVLGNVLHEGDAGRWEGDGHAADHRNGRFSAEVAKIFDPNPGDHKYEFSTDRRTYVDKYSYKYIGYNLDMCWNELYNICSTIANNQENSNPYPGMGSIGQTAGCYYEAYCKWMEANGKATSTDLIKRDEMIECDIYSIEQGAPKTMEEYISDYNNGYTRDGITDNVERACALWYYEVERPANNTLGARREFAKAAYALLKERK